MMISANCRSESPILRKIIENNYATTKNIQYIFIILSPLFSLSLGGPLILFFVFYPAGTRLDWNSCFLSVLRVVFVYLIRFSSKFMILYFHYFQNANTQVLLPFLIKDLVLNLQINRARFTRLSTSTFLFVNPGRIHVKKFVKFIFPVILVPKHLKFEYYTIEELYVINILYYLLI